jgi:exonuclease SbcD
MLREKIDDALAGKAARLVRLRAATAGSGRALGDELPAESLDALAPEEVFRRCYAKRHEGDPPAELLAGFAELLEIAQRGAP